MRSRGMSVGGESRSSRHGRRRIGTRRNDGPPLRGASVARSCHGRLVVPFAMRSRSWPRHSYPRVRMLLVELRFMGMFNSLVDAC